MSDMRWTIAHSTPEVNGYRDAFGRFLGSTALQLRHTRRDGNCFLSSVLYYVFGDQGVYLVKLFREAIYAGSLQMLRGGSFTAAEQRIQDRLLQLVFDTGEIPTVADAVTALAAREGIAVEAVSTDQREQVSAELLLKQQQVLARVGAQSLDAVRAEINAEFTHFFDELRKNGVFFEDRSISVLLTFSALLYHWHVPELLCSRLGRKSSYWPLLFAVVYFFYAAAMPLAGCRKPLPSELQGPHHGAHPTRC